MKLLKNLLFVLVLMPFGCKSADDGEFGRKKRTIWRWHMPVFHFGTERQALVKEPGTSRSYVIKQPHRDALRARGVIDWGDKIINPEEFHKFFAEQAVIDEPYRKSVRQKTAHKLQQNRLLLDKLEKEWKQPRFDKFANDPIRADERTREAQEAEFEMLLTPMNIPSDSDEEELNEVEAGLLIQNPAIEMAEERTFDASRGQWDLYSAGEQQKIQQLLQDFDRADRAGTLPDAYYEELQKAGFMDDQRKVLDYDRLGEFFLQKIW